MICASINYYRKLKGSRLDLFGFFSLVMLAAHFSLLLNFGGKGQWLLSSLLLSQFTYFCNTDILSVAKYKFHRIGSQERASRIPRMFTSKGNEFSGMRGLAVKRSGRTKENIELIEF